MVGSVVIFSIITVEFKKACRKGLVAEPKILKDQLNSEDIYLLVNTVSDRENTFLYR